MQETEAADRRCGSVLDPVDRRLLALLEANARLSATALAREVGLARSSVQARIARLEREGVIAGYKAVLRETAPRPGTRALLSLRLSRRPCAEVIARFSSWPEVLACHSTAGPVDAVVLVQTDGQAALSALSDRLARVHGVASVETTVILATLVERRCG